MNKPIYIVLLLACIYSYGQKKNYGKGQLSQVNGILLFEKSQDVFTMYFIKTNFRDLRAVLQNKDTVDIISIGSPGDDASNDAGYKHYLDEGILFDSLTLIIRQENFQGQQYEDRNTVFSKYGAVKYSKNKGYNLQTNYKRIYLNNRKIVFKTSYYIQIETFTVPKFTVHHHSLVTNQINSANYFLFQ